MSSSGRLNSEEARRGIKALAFFALVFAFSAILTPSFIGCWPNFEKPGLLNPRLFVFDVFPLVSRRSNGRDNIRHTPAPHTKASAGYVQDGICVLWVPTQLINRLGGWQREQLDMAALGFLFHLVHDRQGTRSGADD
jgi:hypothetical protein